MHDACAHPVAPRAGTTQWQADLGRTDPHGQGARAAPQDPPGACAGNGRLGRLASHHPRAAAHVARPTRPMRPAGHV